MSTYDQAAIVAVAKSLEERARRAERTLDVVLTALVQACDAHEDAMRDLGVDGDVRAQHQAALTALDRIVTLLHVERGKAVPL